MIKALAPDIVSDTGDMGTMQTETPCHSGAYILVRGHDRDVKLTK